MTLPRGIRNRNPGNIVRNAICWQGLSADQSSDPRFCVFAAPEWGIRAMARILIAYRERHGLDTVRGIVNRWAPPAENDTDAYVRHVAARLGVRTDARIDVRERTIMTPLVQAIIGHENGAGYADYYDGATIDSALTLAGIK